MPSLSDAFSAAWSELSSSSSLAAYFAQNSVHRFTPYSLTCRSHSSRRRDSKSISFSYLQFLSNPQKAIMRRVMRGRLDISHSCYERHPAGRCTASHFDVFQITDHGGITSPLTTYRGRSIHFSICPRYELRPGYLLLTGVKPS